jgi:2-polyprenyl-6-hydroxyphenyl methylase/3-demethylubiquinone-9 3-methyltransferase
MGYDIIAVDPSTSGIAQGRQAFPHLKLFNGSAYDDLAQIYGQFSIVISLEVVEHCYDPRAYVRTFYDLLEPGGLGILSTPYHGYTKNLALALTGKLDRHFTALWDGGHIKFFSPTTLTALLVEAGFERPDIWRVGRIPPLAKSMIATFVKPRSIQNWA